MAYRKPLLKVSGPGGEDMLASWGSKLIGVRLIDRTDSESDEVTFMFTRKRPYMQIPGTGTPFSVRVGWSETGMSLFGQCTFQKTRIFGEPKQGQQLHLICRAADFLDDLRKVDSEHFDGENGYKTLGDVFNGLFKSSGARVLIHPDIAKLPLPGGYALRWNQSKIDFAADIAQNAGAIIKPMDGKILVLKRGSTTSVSGETLSTIQMPFDENYSFDVELDPQFEFQKVSASYLDTDKGTLEREDKSSGKDGMRDALPHPFSSKEGAKQAAEAVATELKSFTGNGIFTKAGDPTAVSGAAVVCSGFGTPIDETKWLSNAVIHDVIPNLGWTTTVEAEVNS